MTKAQKLLRELLDRQSIQRQRLAELAGVETLTDEQRSEFRSDRKGHAGPRAPAPGRARRGRRRTREPLRRRRRREPRTASPRGPLDGRLVRAGRARGSRRPGRGARVQFKRSAWALIASRCAYWLPRPSKCVRRPTPTGWSARRGWLDRLFADAAAMRLGITFDSVSPGAESYPVTTAGATGAQRGRTEAAENAAWTVGTTKLEPTRNAVHLVFSTEDAARMPGLEDAFTARSTPRAGRRGRQGDFRRGFRRERKLGRYHRD